jgi:hypothetical protein
MAEKYILDYSGKEVNDLLKKVENTPEISLDGYATEEYVATEINKIEIPSVEGLVSEIYVNEELAKKANIDDLNDLASENYVEQQVADLVNSAPDTLDTLGEIAKAIQDNEDVIDALNNMVATKADKTEIPSLTGYATETYVNNAVNPKADKSYVNEELNKKANITDLNGLATEAYVNTEVAKKTDTNYVNEKVAPKADKTYVDTELDKKADATDLNGLASENYVDTKIAALIDSAPETLNTLGEIATAIKENDEVVDTLNAAIGNKANKADVATELAKKANITDIEKLTYNDLPVVTSANLGEIALYIGESGSYINGAWYQVQDGKNYTVQPTYVGNDVVFNSINTQTFGTKMEALYPSMSSTSNFNLECYPINKAEGLYNLAIVGDKIDTKYATNKELGIVMNVTSKLAMGQTFTRNEAKIINDFFADLGAGTGDTRARIAETDTGYWIGLSWTHNAEGRKYIKVALNNPNDIETDILWYWHSVNGITYDENYIELPEDFGALHFCPTYDYEQVILDYILIECPYVEIAYSSSSAIVWKLLDEPLTKIEVASMIDTAVTKQINNAITQTLEGSY